MGYRIGSHRHITGATDDGVVQASPCTLFGVTIGTEVAAQTVKLHDCAAEADAAAGNLVSSIKTDTRGSITFGTDGVACRVGLVAIVSGGAPDITVVYG